MGNHSHPVEVIDPTDPTWPEWMTDLVELGDGNVPAHLWVVGDPAALQAGAATIGTRQPTRFGTSYAAAVAEAAAARGVVVHSGWAKGCDIAGHLAAVEAGGRTCVWVSEGADRPGPMEHARHIDAVIEAGGAFVSEHPPGTERSTKGLIMRNRLIVAAARRGVHVCQTSGTGGTMGAVGWAVRLGRPIYVPDPGERTHPANDGLRILAAAGAGSDEEKAERIRHLAEITYIDQSWYSDAPVAKALRGRDDIAVTLA